MMTAQSKTRLKELRSIAEKLKNNETVAKRSLETWLGEDYKRVTEEWKAQQQLRADLTNKPAAVVKYEKLLRTARLLNARAEKASTKGRKSAGDLTRAAEAAYERALEHLDESFALDRQLQVWFDRELDFSVHGNLQACAGAVPLPITSRSSDRQGDALAAVIRSKRSVTLDVVEHVIADIEHELGITDERSDKQKLEELLGRKLNL